ncbi:MAG: diguanylate cyclase [Bryobacteraceae bacterium]
MHPALMGEQIEILKPDGQPGAGPRVLVADDSPVSRRLLEAVLRKWGYQVIAVGSGAEAWEILQKDEAPQLAILDWMMPGLSGPEVCTLVRRHPKKHYTYLILLTSRHEKEDLIAGMEAGADDYLVKPFDNNELKVRLGPGRRIVELQSELIKAQESLREQATRDSLTLLWNRHAIFEILSQELSRAYRESSPLGIVLADLDKFKSVNDTYGHIAGDEVLREFAARLRNVVRSYDAAGRYGGEEFLIILPGCDAEAAMATAERMRERIHQKPFAAADNELPVTASFGITALPRGRQVSPEQAIRFADEALYRAKQQGRNRCVFGAFS